MTKDQFLRELLDNKSIPEGFETIVIKLLANERYDTLELVKKYMEDTSVFTYDASLFNVIKWMDQYTLHAFFDVIVNRPSISSNEREKELLLKLILTNFRATSIDNTLIKSVFDALDNDWDLERLTDERINTIVTLGSLSELESLEFMYGDNVVIANDYISARTDNPSKIFHHFCGEYGNFELHDMYSDEELALAKNIMNHKTYGYDSYLTKEYIRNYLNFISRYAPELHCFVIDPDRLPSQISEEIFSDEDILNTYFTEAFNVISSYGGHSVIDIDQCRDRLEQTFMSRVVDEHKKYNTIMNHLSKEILPNTRCVFGVNDNEYKPYMFTSLKMLYNMKGFDK